MDACIRLAQAQIRDYADWGKPWWSTKILNPQHYCMTCGVIAPKSEKITHQPDCFAGVILDKTLHQT